MCIFVHVKPLACFLWYQTLCFNVSLCYILWPCSIKTALKSIPKQKKKRKVESLKKRSNKAQLRLISDRGGVRTTTSWWDPNIPSRKLQSSSPSEEGAGQATAVSDDQLRGFLPHSSAETKATGRVAPHACLTPTVHRRAWRTDGRTGRCLRRVSPTGTAPSATATARRRTAELRPPTRTVRRGWQRRLAPAG